MRLRSLGDGDWLAAGGGVVLFVSLFVGWYEFGTATGELLRSGGGRGAWDAWQSFTVTDVLLAVVALAAVGLAVASATRRPPPVVAAYAALVVLVGSVALVLVAIRALDPPGLPGDVASVPAGARLETSLKAGLWLGLAALVAIVAGGLLVLARERRGAEGAADAAVTGGR
jgi:hypothetical protein